MTDGDKNAIWPPAEGLCSPTVPLKDVIMQVHTKTIVNAPATTVWKVLLDTSHYPDWNTFCPKVTIHSQPDDGTTGSSSPSTTLQLGTSMTFGAIMDPKKPQKSEYPIQLRVVDVSTPDAHSSYVPREMLQHPTFTADLNRVYRIAWKAEGSIINRGFRSERFHEIIMFPEDDDDDDSDTKCEVRSWEVEGGVLARAVKWTHGSVLPVRFQDWSDGLKSQSEKLYAETKTCR